MNRKELAEHTKTLGLALYNLRDELNLNHAPFLTGLVRAAEESILVVMTTLQDTTIPESEL